MPATHTSRQKSLLWVITHCAAIIAVLVSLFTGLRIATLSQPALLHLEELLPQGEVHRLHFLSALVFTLAAAGFVLHCLRSVSATTPRLWRWPGWHRVIIRVGYPLLGTVIASGWLLFIGTDLRQVHLICALCVLLYLFLHGGLYGIRWGRRVPAAILVPQHTRVGTKSGLAIIVTGLLLASLGWATLRHQSHFILTANAIPLNIPLEIDGDAAESPWQSAPPLYVFTDGGANFENGATEVELRALHNGEEFYLQARWRDPDESLAHLPLLKTAHGWEVQQQGFHLFNETRHYEDKFAVLLSHDCEFAAAGTAHLGRNPLKEGPANWHGKGYHYSDNGQLHDLWHWKAVRTNDMYLADDNYIASPDLPRPGSRRYTAGYQQDGKESGAYVMNWQWYRPGTVIPKRLPLNPRQLAAYQQAETHRETPPHWVASWFDYQPYSAETDQLYPEGTVMPSVIYNSNRFEGDRADVRARAQWHDGYWTLEMARKLVTGSSLDVPIRDGICLWVSAFDRAQIAHTRHTRAIQLELRP
ncbi:ethylbenzene dehydrogenase-related protein [Microbulbifer pacificus]|uniref:ethylbenzene dehydrogenase-related protein n=1 Tax=Microbulbifer pacificus TaxID=407164 RepID=UPI0018F87CA6|nr:ethylbenzene dehydrogenase-related protein [Microbulbifer pacificus]